MGCAMGFPHGGKILFSATLAASFIERFLIPYLAWFKGQGWETWVAARKESTGGGYLQIPYCDHFVDVPFTRSPFTTDLSKAYGKLHELFQTEQFDLVHTHTPVGSVLTRLAARSARRRGTKVIYTAHGFHFYSGSPLSYWLLWYPIERVMSRYADAIVTINREDYDRARRFAHCDVKYIRGVGIDVERFAQAAPLDRSALLPHGRDWILLLSVGDLIKRKNHQAIISALPLLGESYQLVLCGYGPERQKLEQLARELGVSDNVTFLGFRKDIPQIMKASDVFVFPSLQEGLPVSVMEAMASGLPVVASSIRGISPDLIEDGKTGILLADNAPAHIAQAIRRVTEDGSLRGSMVASAHEKVRTYGFDFILEDMERIYADVLEGNRDA